MHITCTLWVLGPGDGAQVLDVQCVGCTDVQYNSDLRQVVTIAQLRVQAVQKCVLVAQNAFSFLDVKAT